MLDAAVFEKGGECIFVGFTGIFFAAVREEEEELLARLSFYHSKPAFEKREDCIGGLVGDKVDPGVTGSLVLKGENIFHVSIGCWVDRSANV